MKKRLFNIGSLCGLTFLFLTYSAAFAIENSTEPNVRTEVQIPMRDGVTLAANIFAPKADGKFPVILMRTPYGKGDAKLDDGLFYARRGYVFISQDCRGRGTSHGKWDPFANEKADGQDTQKWVASQPWCNGSIATTGGSYVGFTQWISAPNSDDHLKTMFTQCPLINVYDDMAYIGGAYQIALMMGWAVHISPHPTMPNNAYRILPLCTWDKMATGQDLPGTRDWIAHPQFDDFWAKRGVTDDKDITVPIFVVGGWYDVFAKGVLDHFNAVKNTSRSQDARKQQHILMGPWMHILGMSQVGEINFGKDAGVNLRDIQTKWYDHWLKGEDNGIEKSAPVRIFVMGKNQWRDEQNWPLERTQYTRYYFHSKTSANSIKGDGTVSVSKPVEEPSDKFVYDPNNPVPTAGGCNLIGCSFGPVNQAKVEDRNDVLVFTGETLKADLEVTGPVKVILYAASSAVNTDWTAKLVDVYPDGRAFNICDGIIRASSREMSKKPILIEPGKVYKYEIDLWVTSNVFLAGHKVRVEISSSNFSRFDRNLNTDEPFGTGTKMIKATQTVYHNAQHPSHILLPVIP